MEQHHRALPKRSAGHKRGSVREAGNRAFRQGWVRLCYDLAGDFDVARDCEAEERRGVFKGLQCLGLAPRHRAANRAPADAQPHRHQWPGLVTCHVRSGQPRSGKADQQTTGFDPFDQGRFFLGRERRDIGQHDDIGRGDKNVGKSTFHKVCRGLQRFAEIVQRRQKRLLFILGTAGNQGDLPTLQCIISQRDGTGMTLAAQFKPGQAIAKFRWQVKLNLRNHRAGFKRCRALRQIARQARGVEAEGRHGHIARRCVTDAGQVATDGAILEPRRSESDKITVPLEHRQWAKILKSGGQIRAAVMIHTVGEPEHLRRAFERFHPIYGSRHIRCEGGRLQGRHARCPSARCLI